jgi:hypothetical protein
LTHPKDSRLSTTTNLRNYIQQVVGTLKLLVLIHFTIPLMLRMPPTSPLAQQDGSDNVVADSVEATATWMDSAEANSKRQVQEEIGLLPRLGRRLIGRSHKNLDRKRLMN